MERTYHDYTTGIDFKSSKEFIEHELERVNSAIRRGVYSSTADAMDDLYSSLGITAPHCWYGVYPAVELDCGLNMNDLPFKEVKDSETEDKEEKEMNERQIVEFRELNIESTTSGYDRPIALVVTTNDGDCELRLSEDNVKFLIKALKTAKKLINV